MIYVKNSHFNIQEEAHAEEETEKEGDEDGEEGESMESCEKSSQNFSHCGTLKVATMSGANFWRCFLKFQ